MNKKVSSQFVHNTIPQSIDSCHCSRCRMLLTEIERLNNIMQGWDIAINEIKIEAIEDFMREVKVNGFYSKIDLINFAKNYVERLKSEKDSDCRDDFEKLNKREV